MQKVEGSNPFSRFASNPLHKATSPFAGKTGTTPGRKVIRSRKLTRLTVSLTFVGADGRRHSQVGAVKVGRPGQRKTG